MFFPRFSDKLAYSHTSIITEAGADKRNLALSFQAPHTPARYGVAQGPRCDIKLFSRPFVPLTQDARIAEKDRKGVKDKGNLLPKDKGV